MVKEKGKSLLVHHKRNSSSVDFSSSANKLEAPWCAAGGDAREGKGNIGRERKWM